MVTSEITTTKITAEDGYKLTQAVEVEDTERQFWTKLYLAANDSADNYVEWTEEAAEAFLAELEAKQAEEGATEETEESEETTEENTTEE